MLAVMLALAVALGTAAPSLAQSDTLAKIKSTGVLTIGTRTGSPPFAYVNKSNEWVGFTIDLVNVLVKPSVEKAVGRSIKIEKKESTPPTRIPLLSSNAVDLIAGTMTDTPERRQSVDFSLTYFYTGAQFLVKKGSPIKSVDDIAGKRIASQQGATNAKIIREKYPQAQLREFPDQPAAFQALAEGEGAEPERLGGRRRLLLRGAVRHGHAEGRHEVQGRRRRRSPAGVRVGQVLRDLREVVRGEERGAVPDDAAGEGVPPEAGRQVGGARPGPT
jgi:hypothetical protein